MSGVEIFGIAAGAVRLLALSIQLYTGLTMIGAETLNATRRFRSRQGKFSLTERYVRTEGQSIHRSRISLLGAGQTRRAQEHTWRGMRGYLDSIFRSVLLRNQT